MKHEWIELVFELTNEHALAAITAVATAIAVAFNYGIKRLRSRSVKMENSDGTEVAARFQNQQGTFIEAVLGQLKGCNERHDECIMKHEECLSNYQALEKRFNEFMDRRATARE